MSDNFDNNKIWNRALDDIMSESFGKYAKYIIQDRALPDIRDGLKPVQRRILYAMYDLNISHDKPYKKSARTVGEVIGKYHPHGDSSIYEAMVRMSQEWKNNIPLLDMQGNKGSIDGDSAAAMRYTECRLSKFGELMLNNIEKETVRFIPNFDDSENEPSVLPSLLPNILVNGATGIAAGYATNVPSFNLTEILLGTIYRINNPNCSLKEIAKIIKGPDFSTGGIIQGKEGILEMFATGRGKFNIRAKITENTRATKNNKKQLIITEIPYETNKAAIVKSIDELRINNELPGLKEVRDDSDKDGISIVLEFDTEKSLDILKGFLYKKTQLQISYSANIILIKDRKPCLCTLIDILDAYIEHANDIVIKSSTFELKKALNRKEILEGLIKAIDDIDNLVSLIKSSTSKEEAKNKLMDFFDLTEKQAEAVVQLRLYVLTSYDTQKLKDEYNELLEFIDIKRKLINEQDYRNQHLIDTFNHFNKTLGFKRRSVIEDEIEEIVVNQADIVEENHGVCVVTRDCYIKYMSDTNISELDTNKLKIKEGDLPIDMFDMSTLDTLVILTNKGKCLTIPAHKIKMTKIKDNGIHVNELITIDSSEKTIAALAIKKETYTESEILVATKQSQIKRFVVGDISPSKNAKSTTYINLKADDEVVSAFVVDKNHNEIISITSSGYAIRYNIDEVPVVGRVAAGVKNINLKNDDYVSAVIPVEPEESFVLLVSNRGGKRIHFEDILVSGRATIGKRVLLQVESNPYLINSAFMIGGRQYIQVVSDTGKLSEQKVADIPITDNQTRMNSFSNIDGSILKASFIKKNKNQLQNHESINFLSLEIQKNVDKSTDSSSKNEKSNTDLDKLINQPIKQKQKEYEVDQSLLESIDNSTFVETKKENIVESIENNNLDKQEEIDDNTIEKNIDIDDQNNESLIDNNNVDSHKEIDEITIENNNNIEDQISKQENDDSIQQQQEEVIEQNSKKEESKISNKNERVSGNKNKHNHKKKDNQWADTVFDFADQDNQNQNLDDSDNKGVNQENKESNEKENIKTPIIDALLENDNDLAMQLIHYGSDVNELDGDGQTPLMIAANSGNIKIVEMLLKNNVDLDVKDFKYQYTALMYAVQNNQNKIIELLIDAGADVNLTTDYQVNALTIAIEQNNNKEIGQLLIEHGAIDSKNYFEKENDDLENNDDDSSNDEKDDVELENIQSDDTTEENNLDEFENQESDKEENNEESSDLLEDKNDSDIEGEDQEIENNSNDDDDAQSEDNDEDNDPKEESESNDYQSEDENDSDIEDEDQEIDDNLDSDDQLDVQDSDTFEEEEEESNEESDNKESNSQEEESQDESDSKVELEDQENSDDELENEDEESQQEESEENDSDDE